MTPANGTEKKSNSNLTFRSNLQITQVQKKKKKSTFYFQQDNQIRPEVNTEDNGLLVHSPWKEHLHMQDLFFGISYIFYGSEA